MNPDTSRSRYHEDPDARERQGYNRHAVKKLNTLLRRLQFLEARMQESNTSGSAAFVEAEISALEFALFRVARFIYDPDNLPDHILDDLHESVSRNRKREIR